MVVMLGLVQSFRAVILRSVVLLRIVRYMYPRVLRRSVCVHVCVGFVVESSNASWKVCM